MIYGMYLSASGIIANSHRQDVIANNLANAETNGFKRDLASFYQRPTEASARGVAGSRTDPILEGIGGGLFAMPTRVDNSQGDFEATGNEMDVAITGKGFFSVSDGKSANKLTRDGKFMTDADGNLTLASSQGQHVLDIAGQPIKLDPKFPALISQNGTITQNGKEVGRIGLFDVTDPNQLTKVGKEMLAVKDAKSIVASNVTVRSGFIERSNVDPATELTQLMDAQRQLEANANMIRYQDQMLDKLVNTVGRIG